MKDLLYRLYREIAVVDGAKNLLRTLNETKKPDLKTRKDAEDTLDHAQEKMALIRMAVQKYA